MNRNIVQDRIRWFLLSCFGFISSLAKYENTEFGLIAPSLAFPLEQLRANGRPLAIALLVLLLIIALNSPNPKGKLSTPEPIIYLWIVQSVILIKTLDGGDIIAGSLVFAIFSSVVIMHLRGPAVWIQDERSLRLGFWAIAMVGVIFSIANLYQARVNLAAITFVMGWFHGTTANPQACGLLIAMTIPSIICLIYYDYPVLWKRVFWILILSILFLGLYKTASRTSMIMTFVGILFFFRYRMGSIFIPTVFGLVTIYFILSFTDFNIQAEDPTMTKISAFQNTRELVWQSQLNMFIANPLFGSPLTGDRMRFGENSWLGVASGLGLSGLIPMLIFGWLVIQKIISLDKIAKKNPNYYVYCSSISAGLISMMIGSISEAFLLANLNFYLYALLQYLILSQCMEKNRAINN
ncbi:MAG: O-antigen ligase family protein [Woronichinia naegeliana WA131]|uniref:O-antigen ligase family protein n=1 Tax=Woronichinia naegeliana WA131 TaxID=2824559 RepID=A0A977KY13_9CYAN|nr:MAG: O-antigen ligase family protein [Woronichinia naegeliana WA131]